MKKHREFQYSETEENFSLEKAAELLAKEILKNDCFNIKEEYDLLTGKTIRQIRVIVMETDTRND